MDTILEIGLISVGLIGRGGADPNLSFRVSAFARLVEARTNAVLYRGSNFAHATGPRPYSDWSADNARNLKKELARSYRLLGQSIVDEIFLVVRSN